MLDFVIRRRVVEGTAFLVPLTSGHAAGCVSRLSEPIGFGFFFKVPSDRRPSLEELARLTPPDAVLARRFTLGALKRGEWPALGVTSGWERSQWSIPPLIYYDHLRREYRLLEYGDDPVEPLSSSRLEPWEDPTNYPADDVIGEGMLPAVLENLIG